MAKRQEAGKPSRKLAIKRGAGREKAKKIPSLKNRLRAINRTLQRGELSPQQQKEREKAVRELTEKRQAVERAALEKKYAIRYHKVKFFERRKLERSLKQALTALAGAKTPDDRQALQAKVALLEENLEYVRHFPKLEPYVSILRSAENPEAQAELDAKRLRLKGLIRQSLSDIKLLTELNEGRPTASLPAQKESAAAVSVVPKQKSNTALSGKVGSKHSEGSNQHSEQPVKKRRKVEPDLEATIAVKPSEPSPLEEASRPPATGISMAEEDDFFLSPDAPNAMPFLEAPKPPQKLPHREGKEITTSGQGRKEKRRPTARKKDVKPERRSSVARKGIQPSTQPLPRRKRAEGGRKRSKKKS